MNKIVIFSTTPGMSQSCEYVLKKLQISGIPVYELTTHTALEKARECQKNGTKVLVCRGGTAALLRENLDMPIIDIRHSFLSFFLAVRKTSTSYNKVAAIGFSQFCNIAKKFNSIMNESLMVFQVDNAGEFKAAFSKAREIGAEAFIGGFQLRAICIKNNMPFYSIYPDESEVELAIDEALYSLYVEEEREKQYSLISTILDSTSEGIIGIDNSGKILNINKIAKALLQREAEDEKTYIDTLINTSNIQKTIQSGEPVYDELITINRLSLVYSCLPIVINNQINGAVISIQEETNIQIIDSKIRKKQIGRGHYAKINFSNIIGESKTIHKTIDTARLYAKTESTILLTGETGTGKEMFAQSIHNDSIRKLKPFIAINCAALPKSILESELFGYAEGAFTGAKTGGKAGVFEQAHKGTVFLDEITEIPPDVQAKLLRVLQEKEITRIGDNRIIPIDIRIIAACNKDLYKEVKNNNFREDLYYRICVLELKIPPLRERKEDIPALFSHYLQNYNFLTEKAEKYISNYSWPGNVRQLKNVTERANVLNNKNQIDEKLISELISSREDIIERPPKSNQGSDSFQTDFLKSIAAATPHTEGLLKTMEKKLILEVLQQTKGNREMAAAILGISITTLWRKEKLFNSES